VTAIKIDGQRRRRTVAARVPFAKSVYKSEKKPERYKAAGRKNRQCYRRIKNIFNRDISPDCNGA
jgi:hypothetical protein